MDYPYSESGSIDAQGRQHYAMICGCGNVSQVEYLDGETMEQARARAKEGACKCGAPPPAMPGGTVPA